MSQNFLFHKRQFKLIYHRNRGQWSDTAWLSGDSAKQQTSTTLRGNTPLSTWIRSSHLLRSRQIALNALSSAHYLVHCGPRGFAAEINSSVAVRVSNCLTAEIVDNIHSFIHFISQNTSYIKTTWKINVLKVFHRTERPVALVNNCPYKHKHKTQSKKHKANE